MVLLFAQHNRTRWWRIGLLVVLSFLLPLRSTQAQEQPPALTVTIRAADGQPISQALVRVLDRSGRRVFALTMTNAAGQALISELPAGDVRVRITGTWQGIALRQSGADALGILLVGGDPPLTLDLRVTPDGQVLPDPATMITPDIGPVVAIPTAPIAGMGSANTTQHPGQATIQAPTQATVAGSNNAPSANTPARAVQPEPPVMAEVSDQFLLALIAICLVLGAVIVIIVVRWGRAA